MVGMKQCGIMDRKEDLEDSPSIRKNMKRPSVEAGIEKKHHLERVSIYNICLHK